MMNGYFLSCFFFKSRAFVAWARAASVASFKFVYFSVISFSFSFSVSFLYYTNTAGWIVYLLMTIFFSRVVIIHLPGILTFHRGPLARWPIQDISASRNLKSIQFYYFYVITFLLVLRQNSQRFCNYWYDSFFINLFCACMTGCGWTIAFLRSFFLV